MDLGTGVFIIVLLVFLPVGVLVSMAGLAGVLGGLLGRDRDLANRNEDGEPNEYLVLSDANPYGKAG